MLHRLAPALLLAFAACSGTTDGDTTDAGPVAATPDASTETATDAGATDAGATVETADAGTPDAGIPADPQAEEKTSTTHAFVRFLNGGEGAATLSFNADSAAPEFTDVPGHTLSTGTWRGYGEIAAGAVTVNLSANIGFYDRGRPPEPQVVVKSVTLVAGKRYVVVGGAKALAPQFTDGQGNSHGPTLNWSLALVEEPGASTDGKVPVVLIDISTYERSNFLVADAVIGTTIPVGSTAFPTGQFITTSIAASTTSVKVRGEAANQTYPAVEFPLPALVANRPTLIIASARALAATSLGGAPKFRQAFGRLRVLNLVSGQAAPGGSLWLLPADSAPVLAGADVPFLGQSAYVSVEAGSAVPFRWFASSTTTPLTTTPTSESYFNEIVATTDQTAIVANVKPGNGVPESGIVVFPGGIDPVAGDATHALLEAQNATNGAATIACKDSGGATVTIQGGLAALGLNYIGNITTAQMAGLHCEVTVGAVTTTYVLTLAAAKGYRLHLCDSDPSGQGKPFAVLLTSDGALSKLDPAQ